MKPLRVVSLLAVSALIMVASGACASRESRRSFEIGPAIRQMCEGPSMPAAFCPELHSFVATMRSESRDAAWADEMESHIETFLRATVGKEVDIRSLECRSTLCAVEYATAISTGEGPVADAEALLGPLEPESGGIGYELPDKDHPARVVCVMGFRRRAS